MTPGGDGASKLQRIVHVPVAEQIELLDVLGRGFSVVATAQPEGVAIEQEDGLEE